jgi:hypothetical protein
MMKIAALVLLLAVPIAATAEPVDWKFFGYSKMPVDASGSEVPTDTACFYDAAGVSRTLGHVRVWTKCLPDNEILKALSQEAQAATDKVKGGYMPPALATYVRKVDPTELLFWIVGELVANMGNKEPVVRVFWEINCSEKTMGELSTMFVLNGHHQNNFEPQEWKHIAPETNASRLANLVCQ